MRNLFSEKTFITTFTNLGFTRVYKENSNFVVWTDNDVKCEIKPKHISLGWTRKPEELELIKQTVLNSGYVLTSHVDPKVINIKLEFNRKILQNFIPIVNLMASLPLQAKPKTTATKVFTTQEAENEIFYKIAKRYKHALDNKDQKLLDHTRELLSSDDLDRIITIGYSTNWKLDVTGRREHVVPSIMIHNQVITMLQQGKSLTEVAQFIKMHLAIVWISKEEQEKLDIELSLQTVMPKDWKWGDDIFARLKIGDIEII